VRADAIRLLSDMSENLSEIFPFILEILKAGIHEANPVVKQASLTGLIKLFSNTDIAFKDYQEEIEDQVFTKILVDDCLYPSAAEGYSAV